MDGRCVKHAETVPEIDDFKKAMEPAVKWFKENCDPYNMVIIRMGNVDLVSGDVCFSFEVPD